MTYGTLCEKAKEAQCVSAMTLNLFIRLAFSIGIKQIGIKQIGGRNDSPRSHSPVLGVRKNSGWQSDRVLYSFSPCRIVDVRSAGHVDQMVSTIA